jgi:FAD/FMN-containing dehydrogenase
MIKNNSGYDLKHLFIGSEGTLGIVTRAVLKLEDAPKTRNTAFIGLESFDKAAELLQFAKSKLGSSLTSFELIWQSYFRLMTRPPSQFRPPLPQNSPFYVLIEARGYNKEIDDVIFERMLEQSLESGLISDAAIAHSQQELDWFWGIREHVEFVLAVHSHVFLFDVGLPIADMDEYVNNVQAELGDVWEDYSFYALGHMGDGNLHLFISCGINDAATRHRVEEIVYTPLRKIGGSVSAEHGIGMEKKSWLHISRSDDEIRTMKVIKQALDPKGILNPGKIF